MFAGCDCSTRWRCRSRRRATTRGVFFPLRIAWIERDLNRCSSLTRGSNRGLNDRGRCELDYVVVIVVVLFQHRDLSVRT